MSARPRQVTRGLAGLLAAASLAAAAGCGTPQYCSDRSSLESSVKGLKDVKLLQSGGPGRLKSQLQKVESDAKSLASSAKGDFPSQTSAVTSSVSTLKASVQKLPSSPTRADVTALAGDVKQVVSSTKNFVSASDSKCS